jgi:hypothetical protein
MTLTSLVGMYEDEDSKPQPPWGTARMVSQASIVMRERA